MADEDNNGRKQRELLEQADKLGMATQCISLKCPAPPMKCEPIITPVYHSVNYDVINCDSLVKQVMEGILYSRVCTPNSLEVEMVLAKIEGGVDALTFPSGMSAISNTVMCFLRPGDHLVTQKLKYSGTTSFLGSTLNSWNIEYTEVFLPSNGDISEAFRAATKPNTKLYLAETPCNPTTAVIDLEKLGKLGQEKAILTAVDSTFASPVNQQPLKYGIDMVIHSCTKYLAGHSDVLAGCVVFRKQEHFDKLESHRIGFCAPLDPANCSLLLRSLRTLHVRMQRHNENAQAVAEFLENHTKVKRVLYPGLQSHPQHSLAKKQMKGFGGVVSVVLSSEHAAKSFAESLRIFHLAGSLGGVESLVVNSGSSASHGKSNMTEQERIEQGMDPGLVRLSVGIEDIKDILDDLKQALENL